MADYLVCSAMEQNRTTRDNPFSLDTPRGTGGGEWQYIIVPNPVKLKSFMDLGNH